jgi:putative membrane protein
MDITVKLAVLLVAVLHVLFMVLEMLLWNTSVGRRISGLSREQARQSTVLAANQGLYNGFLAAGLLWGLLAPVRHEVMIIFLLVCVVTAGIFGAVTAHRSIFWIQGLPGLIALGLVLYTG